MVSPYNSELRELLGLSPQEKITLQPGDVIEYYDPVFMFGNPLDHRETTILEVNTEYVFPLKLANLDRLPSTENVKKKTHQHYQNIENYSLITEPIPYFEANNVETEGQRINNILSRSTKKIKKTLKKSGLPSDFARDLNTQLTHRSLSKNLLHHHILNLIQNMTLILILFLIIIHHILQLISCKVLCQELITMTNHQYHLHFRHLYHQRRKSKLIMSTKSYPTILYLIRSMLAFWIHPHIRQN